jgi:hypothetical protein
MMMDTMSFAVGFLVLSLGVLSLAWYVAVIVLLFKIWGKVKRLPA